MFGNQKEHEQTSKLKKETKQVFSRSIVLPPLADIDIDCVTRATLHLFLGFTRSLIEMKFKYYRKIEDLTLNINGDARTSIERQLEQVTLYEKWLESQLEGVKIAMAAQQEQTNVFMSRIARVGKVLGMSTLTKEARDEWDQKLEVIEQEFEKWREDLGTTDEEEEDHKFHVLEQLGVVKQTKDELTTILNTNEGFSRRIVVAMLKKHGVDMKLYHDGMIIGNHCFEYAKEGDAIMSDITKLMKEEDEVKRSDSLMSSLDKFGTKMKEIIARWYDVIRVMKSVERLSVPEIMKYQNDTKGSH